MLATNFVTNCRIGISLIYSRNTTLSHNTLPNNRAKGIYLKYSSNITLSHNTLSHSADGIFLKDSVRNTLSHNTVTGSMYGISLSDSGKNTLSNNMVTNSRWAGISLRVSRDNIIVSNILVNNCLHIRGNSILDLLQKDVRDNIVNGRPLIYWQNKVGGTVPLGASQIFLINTTGVEVTGQELSHVAIGLFVAFSSNLSIHHNTISNNTGEGGIFLSRSRNATLAHNTFVDNWWAGIALVDSKKNSFSHNTFANNSWAGISLMSSSENTLSYNTVANNPWGISLMDSETNTLSHNTVSNSNWAGIRLHESKENTLLGNNLVNNGLCIYSSGDDVWHYAQNVTDNNVNGRPLVYWRNVIGGTVPTGAGQVLLINTTGVKVISQELSRASIGLFAAFSSNLSIHHNIAANNTGIDGMGILLYHSENITLSHNMIANNTNGITLGDSKNVTLAHNTITYNEYGVSLGDSRQNTLSHNTVANNTWGISLHDARQNTLFDNSLINNGLAISGYDVEDYLQANVTANVVNGKPLVYWQNVIGGNVPTGAGQVLLINTTGVEVKGQDLSRASIGLFAIFSSNLSIHHNTISQSVWAGIALVRSKNTTLSHNTVSNNMFKPYSAVWIYLEMAYKGILPLFHTMPNNTWAGITLVDSMNITVFHNTVANNRLAGIALVGSEDNTVSHNTLTNNSWTGIRVEWSEDNILSSNTVVNSKYGIVLQWDSAKNALSHNIISNNTRAGIFLGPSSKDNVVKWNAFLRNNSGVSSQASDHGTNNVIASNFWSDHDNSDLNGDGTADAPYAIEGTANNQDPSPLAVLANFFALTEIFPLPKVPRSEGFLILVVIPFFLWFRRRSRRR